MNNTTKVALVAATVGGYVLGRLKRGRLAFAVATYIAGRRFGLDPRQLATEGLRKLGDVPQVAELSEQVKGDFLETGKTALAAVANRRVGELADSLHERTLNIGKPKDEEVPEEEEPEEEEPTDEEPAEEGPGAEEEEPESEEEPDDEERWEEVGRSTKRGAARKSTVVAKKAPGQSTSPAKRAPARKTSTSTPRAAAAEKAPVKKSSAKKSVAKKTASGTSSTRTRRR
ncbi:type IV secretory pathway VirB10-like protein [Kitasatospora herbaricolor]|uniref:histone protein n=1 Tax=Kitasatospora herbaricolor TaxID=68217 RepID=UPI0017496C02|nr:histone protein [Kitasatospora herbaricolor]MDQ0306181.1 type IV secretory pathway VirB10-like protein [Kitasatospora herbaricolor]